MSKHEWLAHYPFEVSPTYPYPKQNLAQFLVDSAAVYPKNHALDFMGYKMTYRALLKSVYRFANALHGLGVRKGDRIAIMLPNCPQLVIAYYGTLLIGGIVVMTNPLYMPRELEHQLKDASVTMLVTLDALLGRVQKATEQMPLTHLVVTAIQDYLPFPKKVLYPFTVKKDGVQAKVTYNDQMRSFVQLLKHASDAPCQVPVDAEEDLALIQYTGGTTGLSKGVMLTHYNLVANTIQIQHWFYKSRMGKERFLAALPFFHVFGMTVLLNKAINMGGELILVPRFKIQQVLKLIDRKKPTVFPGAPTMYMAINTCPEVSKYDLSSIQVCVSGAASLPIEVQLQFEKLTGGKLIEGYGLTEASPVTHANNIWEKRKIGSIGIPLPDTDVRIVDPHTKEELQQGEIGELAVRGPQVMKGYWNRPEDTQTMLRDGWLMTGDIGKMDEDGFFYILDRYKDLIIAGGYNIYPREVEEVLFEHPEVEEAVVAGVMDAYRGETVKAYIKLKSGSNTSAEEIRSWCKERLAAYKVPTVIAFRDAFPKTIVGKVLRRKLIEEDSKEV